MKRTIKTVIFAIFTFGFIANASAFILTFDFTAGGNALPLATPPPPGDFTSPNIEVVAGDALNWGYINIEAEIVSGTQITVNNDGLGASPATGRLDTGESIMFTISHMPGAKGAIGININDIGFPNISPSNATNFENTGGADEAIVSGMSYFATSDPTTTLYVWDQQLGTNATIAAGAGDGFRISSIGVSVAIPEPSSVMLMAAITTAGIFIVRRRRTRA